MKRHTAEEVITKLRQAEADQAQGHSLAQVCQRLERGAPAHIRSDNGPEFIAKAVRAWMSGAGLETLYIAPGAPWENGYAESFNSKVRDELLNAEELGSVLEAKVLAKEWRRDYNQVRPHSSLGYRTPAEFGAMVPRADSAALRRPEEPSVTIDPTLTATGP